jgi:hypothetical protein
MSKNRAKSFVIHRKDVPLQAEYYQNSTKDLILSALLCLTVSVAAMHTRD